MKILMAPSLGKKLKFEKIPWNVASEYDDVTIPSCLFILLIID
jgi:hypothetical protein